MPTFFEHQKKQFNDYCEELQDRFDLILHDGVEVVFDKDFIQFDDLIVVRYSPRNPTPELIVKGHIKNPGQFKLLKNVVNNFPEIITCIKTYITLFNHTEVIKDRSVTGDEHYRIVFDALHEIEKENPSVLTGKTFFIKCLEADPTKRVYLSIDKYGQLKKNCTDLSYVLVDSETGSEDHFGGYTLQNHEVAGDIAYQVSNHIMSHFDEKA